MARRGLTNEEIYEEAAKLVAEKGYRNFSLRELASRLNVAPSSLYEHVNGIEEIGTAVGMVAIERLSAALDQAIAHEDPRTAFKSFACAYRAFAQQNPELYQAIIAIPRAHDEKLARNEQETIAPLRSVVERFATDEKNIIDLQRFVRSALHGFIELEAAGFMRCSDVSPDDSFSMTVNSCLAVLESAEE